MGPRARVSVWPGCRSVPGIVAPDCRGARGAECLPSDILRHRSPKETAMVTVFDGCDPKMRSRGSPLSVFLR
jgi:hypothetical protein